MRYIADGPCHLQKTGNETLAERWMFHKLNQTAIRVNKAFEARNFHEVTEAIHGFWLYELCDVFIVRNFRLRRHQGIFLQMVIMWICRRLPSPSLRMRLPPTSRSPSRTPSIPLWNQLFAWFTPSCRTFRKTCGSDCQGDPRRRARPSCSAASRRR